MRSPSRSIGKQQQQQSKENAKNILVQATGKFYINSNNNHTSRWYNFHHYCIFRSQ